MGYYYSFMALAILGWGLSTSLIEFGLEYVSPFSFLFLRFSIASLILTPFILKIKFNEIKALLRSKWVWFIGISESAGLLFQYLGQREGVPAGLAALLSLIFLIFVPFLSPLILDDRINRYHVLAIVLGFIGVTVIASEGDISNLMDFESGSLLGIVLLILAALSYAFYIVTTSRQVTIENPKTDTTALFYIILVIISVVSFIMMILFETPQLPSESIGWLWISMLVIFSTIMAFFAYFVALKRISANSASVLLLLQALVPFTIDIAILKRVYSSVVIIGVVFVLLAMIIIVFIPILEKNQSDTKRVE